MQHKRILFYLFFNLKEIDLRRTEAGIIYKAAGHLFRPPCIQYIGRSPILFTSGEYASLYLNTTEVNLVYRCLQDTLWEE